jgi:pimeloyl-ACP methyl ester carboxylesterase
MESVRSTDGTRIAYERAGNGPPLVLVHGSLDDHSIWAMVLPALAERFTVYALDRRGRGGSGPVDDLTYAIEREYEDVLAVIEDTGEPVHVMGHSYGAICALGAASLTDRIRSLILCEPPIPVAGADAIAPPDTPERLQARLDAGDPEGIALIFIREIAQLPEPVVNDLRSSPDWPAILALAPTIVHEVRAVSRYTFDPTRYRDLTVPTLLLLGSESPSYFGPATGALAASLPDSRVMLLTGQAHLAMLFDPERFAREVLQFLAIDDALSPALA